VTIALLAALIAGPGDAYDGRARELDVAPPRIEAEIVVVGQHTALEQDSLRDDSRTRSPSPSGSAGSIASGIRIFSS
jgi:hypothetical protein